MDFGVPLILAGLALVDSTSIGTLVIPLWMMLEPRMRVSRFMTYLATVTGFYFLVGIALVLGAGALRHALAGAGDSPALSWTQLAVGVGLFGLSFRYDSKQVAKRRAATGRPDRLSRWRQKMAGGDASTAGVVALALAAVGLEVMTMLPYLAAIGVITTAQLGAHLWLPLLLGYVLVMVLPAIVLFALRVLARRRIEPILVRLNGWMSRYSVGALGWVLGIIGFLLAADAVTRLQLVG